MKVNPLSFVNSFTHPNPCEQGAFDDFWSRILTAQQLPVGLPSELTVALRKKSRRLKAKFVNLESSPIDIDDEGRNGVEVDQPGVSPPGKLSPQPFLIPTQPQSQSRSTLVSFGTKDLDFDLSSILLAAQQVYSTGGKAISSSWYTDNAQEISAKFKVIEARSPKSFSYANLAAATAKILNYLGLPLEIPATEDHLKSELINATTLLQKDFPSSKANLGFQLEDFIFKVYSCDIFLLESRRQDIKTLF
ncbi:hypothetical protein PIB30_077814 [Stylosanthes scabra]|uniref:Uncharacterized protein n=1 Tax=Stylosanthes scabra TaxID=79078 RepID=A0ABU6SRJ7_9FABA|nr:hypothetical protein [Stylosanthes scabra]